MPRYVDGYVLPVPRRNIQAYRRIAEPLKNLLGWALVATIAVVGAPLVSAHFKLLSHHGADLQITADASKPIDKRW
jgi:hypothetical protein